MASSPRITPSRAIRDLCTFIPFLSTASSNSWRPPSSRTDRVRCRKKAGVSTEIPEVGGHIFRSPFETHIHWEGKWCFNYLDQEQLFKTCLESFKSFYQKLVNTFEAEVGRISHPLYGNPAFPCSFSNEKSRMWKIMAEWKIVLSRRHVFDNNWMDYHIYVVF